MANNDVLERIKISQLVDLLETRGQATVEELAEICGSESSYYRYRARLNNEWGYAITYDRSKGVHVPPKHQPGMDPLPQYLWFTPERTSSLLAAVSLINEICDGGLQHLFAPIRKDLLEIVRSVWPNAKKLSEVVHYAPVLDLNPKGSQLAISLDALTQSRQLEFDFFPDIGRSSQRRRVSPLGLMVYRDTWYLDTWDMEKKALRTFPLYLLTNVRVLHGRKSISKSREELDEHFRVGYGLYAGPLKGRAELLFRPKAAKRAQQTRWHHDAKGELLEDGSYKLTLPYSSDRELISDIMAFGKDIKVLSPMELVSDVKTRLRATLYQYE